MTEDKIEIYCDNIATAKMYLNVAKVVNEYFLENYSNASSQYFMGRKAREGIEELRRNFGVQNEKN